MAVSFSTLYGVVKERFIPHGTYPKALDRASDYICHQQVQGNTMADRIINPPKAP